MLGCSSSNGSDDTQDAALPKVTELSTSLPFPLQPEFSPTRTNYKMVVTEETTELSITLTTEKPTSTILVNGVTTESGVPSLPVPLTLGITPIDIEITDGGVSQLYEIEVTKASTSITAQTAYIKPLITGERTRACLAISGDTLAIGRTTQIEIYRNMGGAFTLESTIPLSENEICSKKRFSLSGNVIAIGGRVDNSGLGTVYVYRRSGTTWTQEASLSASNGEAGDSFGGAVSVFGDTIVVGAVGEASNATTVNGDQSDNSNYNTGAAYVFHRENGAWSQEAYLKGSNLTIESFFGGSVSVFEDTVAVGAHWGDATEGSVYIFRRTNAIWQEEGYLQASNRESGDFFGEELSLFGDHVAIGSISESGNHPGINGDQENNYLRGSGAVYVYKRTGNSWDFEAYIKASNPDQDDYFGQTISLNNTQLAVGVWKESSSGQGLSGADQSDNSSAGSGAVYVFNRTGDTWEQTNYIKASNAEEDDRFGTNLALSAGTLVVIAPGEDSNAIGLNGDQENNLIPNSGAVYIFE